MNVRLLALAAVVLLLASPPGLGKVYRWVDAQGQTRYGDQVPGGARSVERMPVDAPDPMDMADLQIERQDMSSSVYVFNRTQGPLQVELHLADAFNVLPQPGLPLSTVLQAGQRALLSRIEPADAGINGHFDIRMLAVPGDPGAVHADVVYSLPVDEGRWELGQGFHGGFSHNDEQNRYAVDLIVAEGTPVIAARPGRVIQVESGFDRGGNSRSLATRANYVRILHDDGSMGMYAHLKEDGVIVRPGDVVGIGEVIGYAGSTGFSSGPHLHFVVQVNVGMRLVSVPFRMVGPNGFLPLSH
jgi:hypothetical protein